MKRASISSGFEFQSPIKIGQRLATLALSERHPTPGREKVGIIRSDPEAVVDIDLRGLGLAFGQRQPAPQGERFDVVGGQSQGFTKSRAGIRDEHEVKQGTRAGDMSPDLLSRRQHRIDGRRRAGLCETGTGGTPEHTEDPGRAKVGRAGSAGPGEGQQQQQTCKPPVQLQSLSIMQARSEALNASSMGEGTLASVQ